MDDPNLVLLESISALEQELAAQDRQDLYRDVYGILYKSAIVGIGSYFERQLMDLIESCAKERSSSPWVSSFIRGKALERQYHTLFDWKNRKVGPFLSAFGEDFKARYALEISANNYYANSVDKFLELGAERNLVAHTYWSGSPSKTASELRVSYIEAVKFFDLVQTLLMPAEYTYSKLEQFMKSDSLLRG